MAEEQKPALWRWTESNWKNPDLDWKTARYVTIGGQRYSHILNPLTGYPVTAVPSVTVIAPTAVDADVWATALSVLGPDGLSLLPDGAGIAALVISGRAEDWEASASEGFARYIKSASDRRLQDLMR